MKWCLRMDNPKEPENLVLRLKPFDSKDCIFFAQSGSIATRYYPKQARARGYANMRLEEKLRRKR
jgi:hypothetical protein